MVLPHVNLNLGILLPFISFFLDKLHAFFIPSFLLLSSFLVNFNFPFPSRFCLSLVVLPTLLLAVAAGCWLAAVRCAPDGQTNYTLTSLTITFLTLSPTTSFIHFISGLNSAFSSSSLFSHRHPNQICPSLWIPVFFHRTLKAVALQTRLRGSPHEVPLDPAKIFNEWQRGHNNDTRTGDGMNVVLPFLHAIHVFLHVALFITRP